MKAIARIVQCITVNGSSVSFVTWIIIVAIKLDDNALMKVSHKSLFESISRGFIVSPVTITILMSESMAATAGATNQLTTITESFCQLISSLPSAAMPEPMSAPTTVCVPEMGIPKPEDRMMKRNEDMLVPSIIFSTI